MEREEAIDVIRNIYQTDKEKEALETLIPELKESEDERIRKFLVKHVSEWIGCIEHDLRVSPKDVESEKELAMFKAGLAYLEKQKEKKFTPDWMPKFLDELRSKKNYFDWDEHRDIEGGILAIINWMAPDYFKQKEQNLVEGDNETEIQKAFREGKSAGRKEVFNYPEEYGLQKPAEWSKNDTVFLNEITDFFENKTVRLQHDIDMYAHWLKSLSERFNLQPKREWSEEDSKRYVSIRTTLETSAVLSKEDYDANVVWLRNLVNAKKYSGPKPSWKPSEEQIGALNYAYCELFKREDVGHNILGPLQNLIDILSKL